jgi:hypothetical protein
MLTEMVVDNYIPNDTHMNEDDSRVQVRTCHTEVSHACFQPCHGTCCISWSLCVYLKLPQQFFGAMVTADRVTWYNPYRVVQHNTSTQHNCARVHGYSLTSLL